MNAYSMVTLRLIHILAGVFWAGVALFNVGFLEPAIKATMPESQKFMQRLMGPARLPVYMNLAVILTVISGLWLYWPVSRGFQAAWITSGYGLGITIGGLAGLLAAILGFLIQGRAAARIGALGKEIQAAGGPPTPEQAAEMQAQQEKLSTGAKIGAVLLVISLLGMSAAQYLFF